MSNGSSPHLSTTPTVELLRPKEMIPIVVVNSLAWEQRKYISIVVPSVNFCVRDSGNNEVAAQINLLRDGTKRLYFLARVAPLGNLKCVMWEWMTNNYSYVVVGYCLLLVIVCCCFLNLLFRFCCCSFFVFTLFDVSLLLSLCCCCLFVGCCCLLVVGFLLLPLFVVVVVVLFVVVVCCCCYYFCCLLLVNCCLLLLNCCYIIDVLLVFCVLVAFLFCFFNININFNSLTFVVCLLSI